MRKRGGIGQCCLRELGFALTVQCEGDMIKPVGCAVVERLPQLLRRVSAPGRRTVCLGVRRCPVLPLLFLNTAACQHQQDCRRSQ